MGAVTPLSRCVGLGHRPEIATDLLTSPRVVDFVEIVAETCFAQASTRRETLALTELWPVVPHGVKLSLGSAEGIDESRLGRLAELARELRAPAISEHVAFTRGGPHEIGHLTQLPRTREAVRVVARNVARARRRLPDVPLLLENVAFSFRWPDEEMDEGTFYREIADATGCPLLLDLGNLYGNAVNEGLNPYAVLARYPLDRVAMLHVAGGVFEDGFYFDTHANAISEPVFGLVEAVLEQCSDVPVLLERDGNFGAFAELRGEIDRVRRVRPARRSPIAMPHRGVPLQDGDSSSATLAADQTLLARLLLAPSIDDADLAGTIAERVGRDSLERARGILTRKRVDDALPLLGRLARRVDELRPIAERMTAIEPRAPRGAGPADALRIAAASAREPTLRDDALRDSLLLRARFAGPDAQGNVLPRVGPFIGSEKLSDGTRYRAFKGFGAFAPVRIQERKARSWKVDSRVSPRP